MDLKQLIKSKLPEDLWDISSKFQIPIEFLEEVVAQAGSLSIGSILESDKQN